MKFFNVCIRITNIYLYKKLLKSTQNEVINIPGESIGLKFISSQLELFRFIPIYLSEPMRIIPNEYEKRFVSRFMKNGQKSIRLNPINS